MTQLVIRYESKGQIRSWRYVSDPEYQPADDELVAEGVDHRELAGKKVDTSTDPPSIVDDSDYIAPESIDRSKVSADTKQAFRDASGDAEAKVDILFEILTGETP